MDCFMCSSDNGNFQELQTVHVDTLKQISFVLPDFAIPDTKADVYACCKCLEQVASFYKIKTTSLFNLCRLNHYKDILKKSSDAECKGLNIVISNQVWVKYEQDTEYEVNTNFKDPLSSEDEAQFMEEDSNSTVYDSRYNSEPASSKKKLKFKCNDCKKPFISRRDLKRHIRVHTGEKPYQCPTCQKSFARSAHLNTHKLTHTGEKPHKCEVCHKTFTQIGHLISHKRCHTNVKPYKCSRCDKAFTVSSSLKVHERVHTGEKPFQCHICPFKCSASDTLQVHIRVHTGERPYICEICYKSFVTSSLLNTHKKKSHKNEESK